MAPPVRTSREMWLEAGLEALAVDGPGGVRVDRIAHRLGVSRGSFHGYFANRAAYLEALLDAWEQAAIDDVIAQVDRMDADVDSKVRRAGELTLGGGNLPVDLAVRDWT